MRLVLVVDDDPDVRELVEYAVTQGGYEVRTASDGEEALREIARVQPALVLLDVMMPGLSGLDVLAQLREREETRALPVIMLTAKAQEGDIERGRALGANDYVIKPFSPRELMIRINAVLAPDPQ